MKRYICIFICCLFLFVPNVKALNGICMISSSSSNVRQNDEVSINFYIHDINNLEINGGYLELKYDNSIFDFIRIENIYNGFSTSILNENGILKLTLSSNTYISNINSNVVIATVKFRVKDSAANGTSAISMIGEDVSMVTDTNGGNNNCLSVGNKNLYFNVYNINNEALLSSLSLDKGSLSPKFNSDITSYDVSVGNSTKSVNVDATCSVSGCTVSGDGNSNLRVGKNVIKVSVTSPNNKVTKTYTIIINREANKNKKTQNNDFVKDSNALLRTLSVSEGTLNPVFVPEVLEYNVKVGSSVEKIRLSAICAGIECTVKGTGNKYLKYGENVYEIEVVAEDGTTNIYTIKVFREYDLRLSNIKIETYRLSPKFDEKIYTYKVTVKNDVDKLNITAQAMDPNVKVRIIGNNNFVDGDNVVKIEVTYDGTDKKVYTINVNREKNGNGIRNNNGIWDNTYVIIAGIVVGVLLFGLIIGIIWFLLKRKNENN